MDSLTSFFTETYAEARAQFLRYTLEKGARLELIPHPCGFTTDVATLEQGEGNWLVVDSGLHGIEGFAGSAIQSYLLSEVVPRFPGWNFMFIHVINPYGMNASLRTNKGNVDLNRNIWRGGFTPIANPGYGLVNAVLNPDGSYSSQHREEVVRMFAEYPPAELATIIASGQSSFPEGLFYAGDCEQPETRLLKAKIEEMSRKRGKVIWVNVHTGVGAKGELICEVGAHSQTDQRFVEVKSCVPEASLLGEGLPYIVHGDLGSYLKGTSLTFLLMEYGTIGTSKKEAIVEGVQRMVAHNQLRRFPNENRAQRETLETKFRELFYPSDDRWREGVIEHFERVVVRGILENY